MNFLGQPVTTFPFCAENKFSSLTTGPACSSTYQEYFDQWALHVQGGFFSLVPPNFSTKKKIANQPITAAVPVNPFSWKDRHWLPGSFLFGTEIGGVPVKKTSCMFGGIWAKPSSSCK